MNKAFKTFIFISLFALQANAQHDFTFRVNGISDTTVYLANYYGGKMYYNDTTIADSKGVIKFKGKDTKPGGIYAVVFPDNKTYFEVVVNEPKIEMTTTFQDPVANMVVNESDENKAFYSYMKFVTSTQKKLMALSKEKEESKDQKEKDKLAEEIKQEQEKAEAFKAKYLEENKGLFAAKVLKTSDDVTVPEFKDAEGNMDDEKRYIYYKAHFWDNVDLTDDRLLRTPVLNQKIATYIEKLTPQVPDSICASVVYLTSKTADTSLIYKFIVQYATNTYEKSDIMGMDAVFVCISENFYAKGKAFWLDEEKTKEIVDMYNVRKNLIVGAKAENIILMDLDSNWRSMYDIKAKYTVLVFWDPNCGHCKKEMPKLKEFYKEWKSKGAEVYSVSTEFDNADWPKHIKENEYTWIDVSDNPEINKNAFKYIQDGKTTLNSLNFRDYWDIYSTPQFYLLDADKIIIAKKINAEQLPDFIKNYEDRQAKIKAATSKAN